MIMIFHDTCSVIRNSQTIAMEFYIRQFMVKTVLRRLIPFINAILHIDTIRPFIYQGLHECSLVILHRRDIL